MDEPIRIAAPIIGKFLSFDDRRSCILAHKCFQNINETKIFHEWATSSNGWTDPNIKLDILKRFKPSGFM